MKILVVSAVFPPEPVVSARLSSDLYEYLRMAGHEVRVVCPVPSRGTGKDAVGAKEVLDPDIVRLDSFRCPESRLLGRARESWDFGRHVATWMRHASRDGLDVVYANVWPLFGQRLIVQAAEALGVPVVLHVQDVYPESLVTKVPPWLYRVGAPMLKAMDSTVVKRCAAVVLISERISLAYTRSRNVKNRAYVVRNWVDAEPFSIPYNRSEVCSRYGVPSDCFTFMYLGNLSALSGLDVAIRAFAKVASQKRQFVIIGEGSAKESCQRLVQDMGLANVLFRSEPDPQKVAQLQSMADVFLLTTKKGGAISSTPSKCISYMLSAKPIVAAVDPESDVADDLRNACCAWLCPPEDVESFANAMLIAESTPAVQRLEMGSSARDYALRNFSRQVGLQELERILVKAGQRAKCPR